jgi:hypothetical protein
MTSFFEWRFRPDVAFCMHAANCTRRAVQRTGHVKNNRIVRYLCVSYFNWANEAIDFNLWWYHNGMVQPLLLLGCTSRFN